MKLSLIISTSLALCLLSDPSSAQSMGPIPGRPPQHASSVNRVPQFDFKPSCRAIASKGVENSRSCEADEEVAREQLSKEWDQFSASARSMCTGMTENFDPSYVELLSCLELMRDAKVSTKE